MQAPPPVEMCVNRSSIPEQLLDDRGSVASANHREVGLGRGLQNLVRAERELRVFEDTGRSVEDDRAGAREDAGGASATAAIPASMTWASSGIRSAGSSTRFPFSRTATVPGSTILSP